MAMANSKILKWAKQRWGLYRFVSGSLASSLVLEEQYYVELCLEDPWK